MKAYGKKAEKRLRDRKDETYERIEMLDLCVLHAYRRLQKAGGKRLEDFMTEIAKVHIDYKHGYFQSDDRKTLGARGDVLAMRRHLAEHGIDYDKMCEAAYKRAEQYELQKYGRIGV